MKKASKSNWGFHMTHAYLRTHDLALVGHISVQWVGWENLKQSGPTML